MIYERGREGAREFQGPGALWGTHLALAIRVGSLFQKIWQKELIITTLPNLPLMYPNEKCFPINDCWFIDMWRVNVVSCLRIILVCCVSINHSIYSVDCFCGLKIVQFCLQTGLKCLRLLILCSLLELCMVIISQFCLYGIWKYTCDNLYYSIQCVVF